MTRCVNARASFYTPVGQRSAIGSNQLPDGRRLQGSSFAYGPGEQVDVNQMQQYNAACGTFFKRLKKDGIDETNTLFVILVDEGDQFAGRPASSSTPVRSHEERKENQG
jgi:hypothetical protein